MQVAVLVRKHQPLTLNPTPKPETRNPAPIVQVAVLVRKGQAQLDNAQEIHVTLERLVLVISVRAECAWNTD